MSAETAAQGVCVALEAIRAHPEDIEEAVLSRWQI